VDDPSRQGGDRTAAPYWGLVIFRTRFSMKRKIENKVLNVCQ